MLSRREARAFDARAIHEWQVPSVVLMENAGRGAAEIVTRDVLGGTALGKVATIVCGPGNNGGDGFVVARHLLRAGAIVRALLVGARDSVSGDARIHLDAFVGVGGDVREIAVDDEITSLRAALEGAHVIVDALFGTGLDRPLTGGFIEIVRAINGARSTRVALDVPSGLDADTGTPLGIAVEADFTVTFAHYKRGLFTSRGARNAGVLRLADIGVPSSPLAEHPLAQLLERADVARLVSSRPIDAHKVSAGHVLAIAGSPGKIGAALMVAHASLRAGAGVVTIATWPESAGAIESRVLEVMSARLSRVDLAASIDGLLAGKRAIVVGPGLGLDDDARRAAEHVVANAKVPLVVDADALTLFAARPEALSGAFAAILTPHPGEAARLLETTADGIEADRFGAVRALAQRARSVVVLKGPRTLIAAPDGRIVVNRSGTSALATAGAGDVLAGIVGALACSLEPFDAACAGVYLHGLAGEAWSETGGDRGLLGSEIADRIPPLLAALVREHSPWLI